MGRSTEIDLPHLLEVLEAHGPAIHACLPTQEGDEGVEHTTIRPPARVRRFYEEIGKRLMGGASLQNVMAAILTHVMEQSTRPVAYNLQNVVQRFYHVFRAHKIASVYIKTVLEACLDGKREFPLAACADNDDLLLNTLDADFLWAVSDLFGVSIDWLDGRQPLPVHIPPLTSEASSWALPAAKLIVHPVSESLRHDRAELLLVVAESSDPNIHGKMDIDMGVDFQIIPVVCRGYTIQGRVPFSTYHSCAVAPWNRASGRVGLRALIKAAQEWGVPVAGYVVSTDAFMRLSIGQMPIAALRQAPVHWEPSAYIGGAEDSMVKNDQPESDALLGDMLALRAEQRVRAAG